MFQLGSMRTIRSQLCCSVMFMLTVLALDGPNVCMVQQKYNITKRIKYRAPMSIRTYEWCLALPPRCSKWSTEMRDLTRLETEERTAEVAVCCPGYKMTDIACVPICPSGKTGQGCLEDCPPKKWGPNCVNDCRNCSDHGSCSPINGQCRCHNGWQGESCEIIITTTTVPSTTTKKILTTKFITNNTTLISTATTTAYVPSVKTNTSIINEDKTNLLHITTSSIIGSTVLPVTTATSGFAMKENKVLNSETLPNTVPSDGVLNLNKDPMIITPNTIILRTTIPDTTLIPGTKYNQVEFTTENETVKPSAANENLLATTFETINNYFEISTAKTKLMIEKSKNFSIIYNTEETPHESATVKTELRSTIKPETTLKTYSSTTKFKPKEIWIRPAQKGDAITELKFKPNEHKNRGATKKEFTSANTTPRTIIVSIIPTSISYSTFKKVALTTALYSLKKTSSTNNTTLDKGFTKPISVNTFTPESTSKTFITTNRSKNSSSIINSLFQNMTKLNSFTSNNVFVKIMSNTTSERTTNSMTSTLKYNVKSNSSTFITVTSSTNAPHTRKYSGTVAKAATANTTNEPSYTTKVVTLISSTVKSTTPKWFTIKPQFKTHNVTASSKSNVTVITTFVEKSNSTKRNLTTNMKPNFLTTDDPLDNEETFHILTEPEHITAVMNQNEKDRTSLDLISVISIAGGVMMAIITVAVVIVMIERCRRPRYEQVRKINDNIRMHVMIENNDVPPPPYVRSIFHTPLPDPPTSDRCHYQPISTLDRNLKQFMRPVVVQAISPIMLENFRDILECHYDHLPRRARFEIAPSTDCCEELCDKRASSLTDSTIEALKCEARLDEIDSAASEPLYAEIPAWRPPSEHAIEIMTINGEAVTEL